MDIKKKIIFKLDSVLCELASITEDDVDNNYVKGLQKQATYIENIPNEVTLEKQREYIKKIRQSEDDCIFGLFFESYLIGTAGVQNITELGFSTIGLFVFNENNRGKGYGKILVWASSYILREVFGCLQFSAGMKKTNIASFKSFNACGYNLCKETDDSYIMRLNALNLIIPNGISQIEIIPTNRKCDLHNSTVGRYG